MRDHALTMCVNYKYTGDHMTTTNRHITWIISEIRPRFQKQALSDLLLFWIHFISDLINEQAKLREDEEQEKKDVSLFLVFKHTDMVHIFPSVATWARRTQVARVLDGGYLLCSVHERNSKIQLILWSLSNYWALNENAISICKEINWMGGYVPNFSLQPTTWAPSEGDKKEEKRETKASKGRS